MFSILWLGGFSKGHVHIFLCSQVVTVTADLSFVKMCYFYDKRGKEIASLAGPLRSPTDMFHTYCYKIGRDVEWCVGKRVAHAHM